MKHITLITLILITSFTSFAQQTYSVKGILPDANAKTGTWTEYQTYKKPQR
jgi:hypothetical protein